MYNFVNSPSAIYYKFEYTYTYLTFSGILIGRDLILQNAGWAVGDGDSINVWTDPWLSLSEPRRPMGPAPERFVNLKVRDLMLSNGSDWNRDLIQQILPQEEAIILSIKSSRSGAPDKLIWLGTSSGEYTTKSGYLKALEYNPTSPPPNRSIDWNNGVWKLKVAPKIKLFLWKIFQGALAVGDRLASRNISTGTGCKTCNNGIYQSSFSSLRHRIQGVEASPFLFLY